MTTTSNTASDKYTRNRIEFLAEFSPKQIADLGSSVWDEKYANKIYPEMQAFVKNLYNFGFEIYAISCSPEFLYQDVIAKHFNIPVTHIVGAKGVVSKGIMTNKILEPFPCHEGKASYIATNIKTTPMIGVGNSGGDTAMVEASGGIKIWVNPNEKLAEKCASQSNCMTVRSNDTANNSENIWLGQSLGLKENTAHTK